MNLFKYLLFYAVVFGFHFCFAKYTCASLFVEKPTFEQQYKSVVEDKKLTLLRDIPLHSDSYVNFKDYPFESGQEFLVRLADLTRAHENIAVSELSTHNINGIRHIVIQIEDLINNQFLIEVPQLNTELKSLWIAHEKLSALKGIPVKAWDKQITEMNIAVHGNSIMRPGFHETDRAISQIQFDTKGNTTEVEFSETSFLFRQSHLFSVLLKKFIADNPGVNRIKADLVGTNQARFIEALIEILTGRKIQINEKTLDVYTARIHEVIRQRSKTEVNEAVQKAVMQTPMYQSGARFGFTQIENLNYESHPQNFSIQYEAVRE